MSVLLSCHGIRRRHRARFSRNDHVAVDVAQRSVGSEVQEPAVGLHPLPLASAVNDRTDQMRLARNEVCGPLSISSARLRMSVNMCLTPLVCRQMALRTEHNGV